MVRVPMSHWVCDTEGCETWEDTIGSIREGLDEIRKKDWKVKGGKHFCPRCHHRTSGDCLRCVNWQPRLLADRGKPDSPHVCAKGDCYYHPKEG